ncbi:hypothetical protein NP572_05645 [Pseudomonas putida]|uniref:hypothetical protein n=1 Tax=Pseudomonas putida TaxID=303 RepID=UPI00236447EA|nr:hypothetical protein [Pseudomonas putida]MDD2035900.1 hypothetical protein [Pseudomonas putida]MDD2041621.1 hypothetical protein [Pseudomonas putida]
MKMKTLKPLYLGGKTLVEGNAFITDEQHGRELIQKGYAQKDEGSDEALVDLTQGDAPAAATTSASVSTETKPKATAKKKAD